MEQNVTTIPKTAFAQLEIINNSPKTVIPDLIQKADPRLQELIGYALHPNVVWLLPEGRPEFSTRPIGPELDSAVPAFLYDVKKLYIFCQRPNDTLTRARREQLFVNMLSEIHPEDAELLIKIKDKEWPFKNITLAVAKKALPNLFANV